MKTYETTDKTADGVGVAVGRTSEFFLFDFKVHRYKMLRCTISLDIDKS